MKISDEGLELVKRSERFIPNLYNCPAGHCTIGYGHLVHYGPISGAPSEVPFLKGITEEQATALLRTDVAKAERAVEKLVKVPLTQGQFDALVDFTFNLGEGNLASSRLLRVLNAGDYSRVPDELERWVYAGGAQMGGLIVRRKAEVELFIRRADAEVKA